MMMQRSYNYICRINKTFFYFLFSVIFVKNLFAYKCQILSTEYNITILLTILSDVLKCFTLSFSIFYNIIPFVYVMLLISISVLLLKIYIMVIISNCIHRYIN